MSLYKKLLIIPLTYLLPHLWQTDDFYLLEVTPTPWERCSTYQIFGINCFMRKAHHRKRRYFDEFKGSLGAVPRDI
jgi:hypothetical protein